MNARPLDHWLEVCERRIDDLQYLSDGGLLSECLVPLGGALSELALQLGNEAIFWIGEHAVGHHAQLQTSSGIGFPSGSYRDRHGPPPVVSSDGRCCVAE